PVHISAHCWPQFAIIRHVSRYTPVPHFLSVNSLSFLPKSRLADSYYRWYLKTVGAVERPDLPVSICLAIPHSRDHHYEMPKLHSAPLAFATVQNLYGKCAILCLCSFHFWHCRTLPAAKCHCTIKYFLDHQ